MSISSLFKGASGAFLGGAAKEGLVRARDKDADRRAALASAADLEKWKVKTDYQDTLTTERTIATEDRDAATKKAELDRKAAMMRAAVEAQAHPDSTPEQIEAQIAAFTLGGDIGNLTARRQETTRKLAHGEKVISNMLKEGTINDRTASSMRDHNINGGTVDSFMKLYAFNPDGGYGIRADKSSSGGYELRASDSRNIDSGFSRALGSSDDELFDTQTTAEGGLVLIPKTPEARMLHNRASTVAKKLFIDGMKGVTPRVTTEEAVVQGIRETRQKVSKETEHLAYISKNIENIVASPERLASAKADLDRIIAVNSGGPNPTANYKEVIRLKAALGIV